MGSPLEALRRVTTCTTGLIKNHQKRPFCTERGTLLESARVYVKDRSAIHISLISEIRLHKWVYRFFLCLHISQPIIAFLPQSKKMDLSPRLIFSFPFLSPFPEGAGKRKLPSDWLLQKMIFFLLDFFLGDLLKRVLSRPKTVYMDLIRVPMKNLHFLR